MNSTINMDQFNERIAASDTVAAVNQAQLNSIAGGNATLYSIITEDEGIRIVEEDGGLLIVEDYGGI